MSFEDNFEPYKGQIDAIPNWLPGDTVFIYENERIIDVLVDKFDNKIVYKTLPFIPKSRYEGYYNYWTEESIIKIQSKREHEAYERRKEINNIILEKI